MTPEEFLAAVETSAGAELERLDSALAADTPAGGFTAESALRAAARSDAAARDRFAAWAEGAVDDVLHDTYVDVAEREAQHYERLLAELPDESVESTDSGLDEYLRDVRNPAERLGGGFVGRALVESRALARLEASFAHHGESRRADILQDLRSETEPDVQRGADLLAEFCRMDDDWERALDTATRAVVLGVEDWVALGESDVESRS
ncbi:hypothetical protein [Halospeciosus flavus]|uniref:Rubrerythrin family protein n=1 Tax=Halospeciosus flavus TaxID=3032283 RepID=A0ABD5Z4X5_9EURY|nr:hypothetical protein [Halospeciosus flavus]